jgi:hypothetical protein
VIYTITIYPKQYWQVLNSLKKGDNSSKNPEIQVNFEKIIEHFKSQGSCKNYNVSLKNKVENHIPVIQYKNLLTENSITDKPFTISEIKQCINILKTKKGAGPDLITNEIIKYSSVATCKSIVKLYNLILISGKYPSAWRKSFIILIHKSGDKSDLNNYRGISLQNCIVNLFSSALSKRHMSHYENLFSSQQFGFRPHHSTTDSLFILKTLISKYVLKKKTQIFSCFVDLRKAFDTVWHNGLLYKLRTNKIGHKFFNIIQNMYNVCQSAVKIDNKHSNYFNLEKGVEQ